MHVLSSALAEKLNRSNENEENVVEIKVNCHYIAENAEPMPST